MPNCDGWFDTAGIPFLPEFQDAAIRAVRVADFHDDRYKKWLIFCWFDTTYGTWNGSRFDLNPSRSAAREYLQESGFADFEQMISTKLPTTK